MKTLNIIAITLILSTLFYSCNKNEFVPEIADQEFSIAENSEAGTQVGTVEAFDADDDQIVSFEIIEGNLEGFFQIDHYSGVLTVSDHADLDYESATEFAFRVSVNDNHEKEPLESAAKIKINLTDENEFAPIMDNQSFNMDENPENNQDIGQIEASDGDTHQILEFSIVSLDEEGYFNIDPRTGILSVKDSVGFDFELNQEMTIVIKVQDDHSNSMADTASVLVTIQNIIELTDDLVAFYPFDGNAMNMIEDLNHGIETNVQYEADRLDNPNSSCFLSGNESFITIPHTEDLNFDAQSESYSIAFWFKSSNPLNGGDNAVRLVSKWNEKLSMAYPYSFMANSTALNPVIFEQGQPTLKCQISQVWDDQWHQIVMVFDQSLQQMSTYLDNQLIESNTHQFSNPTTNNEDILIGKRPVTDLYYSGSIDNLYFYNRTLSEDEVAKLYQMN